MTNIRNLVVCCVAMAAAVVAQSALAQDDLDNLLKDLEAEAAESAEAPAAKAEEAPAEKAGEAPAAEVKAASAEKAGEKPAEAALA